jgi:phosphoribosylaminoimidazole-succinocarboxamide synthase
MYSWPSGPDGDERLLMVATDAISAFDHVIRTPIPDKGRVLTQLSVWWFDQLADIVPNHVVSDDVPEQVAGRALVTEKLEMIPVECVARGYLTGSGWAEYTQDQSVCGIPLQPGLRDGDRLPEPIFTPAVKAPVGEHDENVSFEHVVELHGLETASELRRLTLELYSRAEQIARERGIILADTKFEFGRRPDGTIVLADEVLTPDSSRFWDAELWSPGESLPSFDKQYVRDWLAHDSGWDKASDTPPPALPDEVVAATRSRYLEAYQRLTGRPFEADSFATVERMARVVVDVMPKPEILDPQGKAVTAALARLGFEGMTVRQGRRFEVTVDGDLTDARLDQIRQAAEKLLANTEVEYFDVRVER